ncbi:MAG: hypothetical protein IPL53_13370 [Ignavibacteria bacterium]|nr:hypothetical protein [Ignavibacteria bacterium]
MEPQNSSERKRIIKGILIGIVIFLLSAGVFSMAILMVSVMVMGCTKSPPDWVYMIVFFGFPIPLIITSIVVPYLYIKRQRVIWMFFTPIAGLFLSCLTFLIWFLILTQYC